MNLPENKRFRLYLDELLEDIVGTPREEEDFGHFERVGGCMNLLLERLGEYKPETEETPQRVLDFERGKEEFLEWFPATP